MGLTDAFIGRASEFASIIDSMSKSDLAGVLLTGPAGVGKTSLAFQVLRHAGLDGFRTEVVFASSVSRRVPLGALAALPGVELSTDEPTQTATTLVDRCVGGILDAAEACCLALLVDDAHLLDDMSLMVMERLARSDRVFLVVTARTGEGEYGALLDFCAHGLLTQLRLPPLSYDDSCALVEGALGGPVDHYLARQFFDHSEGNPLFILELLRGSLESRQLLEMNGAWRLTGAVSASAKIIEVIEARLRGLTTAETELLELLAFVDRLTKQALDSLSNAALLPGLEDRGLIETRLDQRELFVSLAHPLYGDVLRANLSGLRTHSVTMKLAEHFGAMTDLADDYYLQLASLRLICGGGDPEMLRRATRIALSRHDLRLAVSYVDASIEQGGGVASRILKARVLGRQGEFEKADQQIVSCLESADSDQLAEAAALRLDFLTFYQGNVDDALSFAAAIEKKIQDPQLRDGLAVRRSGALLHTDGPQAIADALEPVLARSSSEVESWANMLGGWAYLRLGRLTDALSATHHGDAAQNAHTYPSDWYPEIHSVVRCYVHAASGRIDFARETALDGIAAAIRQRADEARAGYALFLASLARDVGHTDDAILNAGFAVDVYKTLGRPVYLRDAIVHRAIALAMAGRGDDAIAALVELDRMEMREYWYFSPELLQARAWAAAAKGRRQEARTHFLESVRISEASGDLLGALTAWHGCARIGFAREAVRPMKSIVGKFDDTFAELRMEHVVGMANYDSSLLMSVSERFESAGAELLAGEAAISASDALRRRQSSRAAENWQRRATAVFRRQRGSTVDLLRPRPLKDLTEAEFETARLAGQGRSNAEIAKDLGLSIRTVENRLQRVYVKLGVNTRHALTELHASVDARREVG